MPIPVAGLVAAAAAPELLKMFKGAQYAKRSRDYSKAKRPDYEIPQSLKDYLAATKFEAGVSGLPGEGVAKARMDREAAASRRAIMQSGQNAASQIAGIAGLSQQAMEQEADLAERGAQYRARRLGDLYSAQRVMGGEEQKKWAWEKQEPYVNAMNLASQYDLASQEAVFKGFEGLAGIAQSAMMMGAGAGAGAGGTAAAGAGAAVGDYSTLPGMPGDYSSLPGMMGGRAAAQTGYALPSDSDFSMGPSVDYGALMPQPYKDTPGTLFNMADKGQYPFTPIMAEDPGMDFPSQLTNKFNSQYFDMPVDEDMSRYYGLRGMFNRTFNNIFRRRLR
jgi:hypothetical protein